MTARIYVGTYAKYNAGNLAGAWLDLEDYADKDSFLEACAELHKDEEDPENYIDFEAYARDARLSGDMVFAWHKGELFVFYNG